MATYRDLDKSGSYRTVVIGMGPTYGNQRVPVSLEKYFIAAGNYTWEDWVTQLIVLQTLSAAMTVFLPKCSRWMANIYGGTDLIVKDGAGVAGASNITLSPFVGDIIQGPSVIQQNLGSIVISPLPGQDGWSTVAGVRL